VFDEYQEQIALNENKALVALKAQLWKALHQKRSKTHFVN